MNWLFHVLHNIEWMKKVTSKVFFNTNFLF
jgi:hypothetical protein